MARYGSKQGPGSPTQGEDLLRSWMVTRAVMGDHEELFGEIEELGIFEETNANADPNSKQSDELNEGQKYFEMSAREVEQADPDERNADELNGEIEQNEISAVEDEQIESTEETNDDLNPHIDQNEESVRELVNDFFEVCSSFSNSSPSMYKLSTFLYLFRNLVMISSK